MAWYETLFEKTFGVAHSKYKKDRNKLILELRELTNKENNDLIIHDWVINQELLKEKFSFQSTLDYESREWYETCENFNHLINYLCERFRKNSMSLATAYKVLDERTGLSLNYTLRLFRELIFEQTRKGFIKSWELFLFTDLLWYYQIEIGHSSNYDFYVNEYKKANHSDLLLNIRIKDTFPGSKNIFNRKCLRKLVKSSSKKVLIDK